MTINNFIKCVRENFSDLIRNKCTEKGQGKCHIKLSNKIRNKIILNE